MITQDKYNQMWQAMKNKQITEAQWKDFCQSYLRQLLGQSEVMAMLKRMKDQGDK